MVPHSSLGDRVRLCLKLKIKNENNNNEASFYIFLKKILQITIIKIKNIGKFENDFISYI